MHSATITKLPKSKVEIKVVLPPEDFSPYFESALQDIAKTAELDGFRKGSAPKDLVLQRSGQEKVMARAAQMAVEKIYPAIISENKLEPLGYPEIEITKLAQGNPLEFTAAISVMPEIVLPDYSDIASKTAKKEVEVTKEDIERLKMEKTRHEREHVREDLIGRIASQSDFEVPESLAAAETEKMMAELKEKTPGMLNMSFNDYLAKIKKTEQELEGEIFSQNTQKIKNYLVLQEISKRENIDASEKEVQDAIDKAGRGQDAAGLDSERIKEYYKDVVKTEKVFEFLESLFGKNEKK
jgi:FKBP-type peptidyl-prolyl cis-trans isomerase (trigger factor)